MQTPENQKWLSNFTGQAHKKGRFFRRLKFATTCYLLFWSVNCSKLVITWKFILKRLSTSQRRNLEKRRLKKANKICIRKAISSNQLAKIPPEFRKSIKIDCPTNLSLSQNYVETITFFTEIKKLSNHILERKRFRPTSPSPFSIGLGNLEKISVRCAVMLSSELERLQQVSAAKLKYSGSTAVENEALSLLRQMGCFELLGIQEKTDEASSSLESPEINLPNGHRTALRLISGRQIDNTKFEKFEVELSKICDEFSSLKVLNGAMGEAILNVKNHAYLSDMKLKFPSPGKRWWAVASITSLDKKLKIIVYDQGHGIGKTLPKTGILERLTSYFDSASSSIINTSDLSELVLLKAVVKRALNLSSKGPRRSRTGLNGRGKGLGDILKPIEMVPSSSIRIASGAAEVTYDKNSGIKGCILPRHLGGTLVEWMFEV